LVFVAVTRAPESCLLRLGNDWDLGLGGGQGGLESTAGFTLPSTLVQIDQLSQNLFVGVAFECRLE